MYVSDDVDIMPTKVSTRTTRYIYLKFKGHLHNSVLKSPLNKAIG